MDEIRIDEVCRIDASFDYDPRYDIFLRKQARDLSFNRPVSICIRLGKRCNLECDICIADSVTTDLEATDGDVRAILDVISEFAPLRVVWSGGEPTEYERLRDYVRIGLDRGLYNMVATNMSLGDPLRDFASRFFYNVSLYGIDKASYRNYTRRDLFSVFVRNFTKLFSDGHRVGATIIVRSDWGEYLPSYLDWLASFPLAKLTLNKMIQQGRNTSCSQVAMDEDLKRLESYLLSRKWPWLIVFPSADDQDIVENGLIVVDPGVEHDHFGSVCGQLCRSKSELLEAIQNHASANRRLYGLMNYL